MLGSLISSSFDRRSPVVDPTLDVDRWFPASRLSLSRMIDVAASLVFAVDGCDQVDRAVELESKGIRRR